MGRAVGVGERLVDRQRVSFDQVRDYSVAVAERDVAVGDVGELRAGRVRRVEDVLMPERQADELQEGAGLQAVRIVVRQTEQLGIGE